MKKNIRDLAIFGAKPLFRKELHVGRPNIGNQRRLFKRLQDVIDRRWLTNNGPYVQDFEKRICARLGVRNCVVVCNGTVALEIATRALEFSGEVIVPSFTFIATAHALQWQGITPVFCDIRQEDATIDPELIEKLITPRTTGIIGVHLWGQPCNIGLLESIAKNNKIRLIFDAAHAFGCSYKGQMIGNFGDAEVFSFHATKIFNSFEGGAILTHNDALAEKIRLMRNFGFAGYDNVKYIGTNGKMSEAHAAMGITGLESLDKFIESNRNNYNLYRKELSGVKGIEIFTYKKQDHPNYHYIIILIDESELGLSRDQLVRIMHAENILVRKYFYPGCHRMEPYFSSRNRVCLPVTERFAEQVIALPTGQAMKEKDIKAVCNIIKMVSNNAAEVQKISISPSSVKRNHVCL